MRDPRPYKPFTAEMMMWLIENYRDKPNAELAKHLGCSVRTIQRRMEAIGIGLGKSDEFFEWRKKKAAEALKKVPPHWTQSFIDAGKKHRFKKGHKMHEMMSEEMKQRLKESRSAKMKENFKKDRLRVRFGLQPKTKLRIDPDTKYVKHLRYTAKKQGYTIARASMDAYYDTDTKRNEILEQKAERLGFRFMPKQE